MKHIRSDQFRQQPGWFSFLNQVWGASYPLGTRSSLEKDSLIKAARKATGLQDFGQDLWEEPLEVMLKSIREEANLHPIGRFITRQRLINLLSVRLRAAHYFKQYPEILEQELYPCTVIVGLQRTGTTKLQRLLAADPDSRSILSWEALNPAPIKHDDKTGKERIKIAKTSVKALKFMSPGFFAIHPIEYASPEEDVLLLDVSFLSTTTEATMHVPTYAAYLESADQSPAYAYMVKLLKLLQWQRPGKRWVLKTPHHLEFLPLAQQYFGKVHFVWTHREVNACIPSFLSMVAHSRVLFSNEVDPEQVAEHWIRKNAYMLSEAMAYRKANAQDVLFTDILYEDLLRDPMAAVKRIYRDEGLEISESLEGIFKEENRKNPQGKYGSHHYELSDFGVNEAYLQQYVGAYEQFQHTIRNEENQQ